MSNRAFAFTFLALATSAFFVVGLLNFVVNPYAQYSTQVVQPLVQTSRNAKLELLNSFESAPDGLLVGSSRVLKYEPAYLEQYVGHNFFNAGVNYGKPEDFLAFVRYFENRFKRLPKTIVIGLDVHGFNGQLKTDARLLNNHPLASQIPEAIPFSDRFQSFKELLSWQQTMASLRSIKHSLKGVENTKSPEESFQSDGLIVYHTREEQIDSGTYDFTSALEYNKREYKQLFRGYDSISASRVELLAAAIKLCKKNGSRVITLLTPMHPALAKYLNESTTYSERRLELHQTLAALAIELDFEFSDLSDIRSFRGDPSHFVDGIHPLEPNTRLIIDRLLDGKPRETQYVVQ